MPDVPVTETHGWQDQDPTALTDKAIEKSETKNDSKLLALREFLVEKIEGSIKNIGTRLDGNDTALVAALKAQKEEAAKQTENFKEVLGESKKGTEKQFDALNEKIDYMRQSISESSGSDSGIKGAVTMLIAAVAAIAAAVSVVIVLSRPGPPTQVQVQPPMVPQLQHPALLYELDFAP